MVKQARHRTRLNRVCFRCGLIVRFQKLPTSPREDAVPFRYRFGMRSIWRGLSPRYSRKLTGVLHHRLKTGGVFRTPQPTSAPTGSMSPNSFSTGVKPVGSSYL